MSVVIPFSQALRERTSASSATGDIGCTFMADLMTGRGTRDDYIEMLAQHWFVYEALETAAARFAGDPVAAPFLSPALTRLPAITSDLAFLLGDDWRSRIRPLAVTSDYCARIRAASEWVGGFIAHHYTRYLGDLSGGQLIRGLMQRQFGFDTNGVGFFLFAEIAAPKEFKTTYRQQLDAVDWSPEARERVLDEVAVAYRFSTELFVELAAAKAAAAAA
jgi:heme oxygenase